jgi:hypothetical protein
MKRFSVQVAFYLDHSSGKKAEEHVRNLIQRALSDMYDTRIEDFYVLDTVDHEAHREDRKPTGIRLG